jgi:hypothetical protein
MYETEQKNTHMTTTTAIDVLNQWWAATISGKPAPMICKAKQLAKLTVERKWTPHVMSHLQISSSPVALFDDVTNLMRTNNIDTSPMWEWFSS